MEVILVNSLLFVAGLALLIFSSDWLIQTSVKFSQLLRLTPMFIGLVLIAFGTSAPEAGVGIMAAIRDQKGIALGNIIGSNISNIALIIGLCAMFRSIEVKREIFRREVPIMLFATLLFYFVSLDCLISRIDGVFFLITFVAFCVISFRGAHSKPQDTEGDDFEVYRFLSRIRSRFGLVIIIAITLAGVVLGADLMVRSGSKLAAHFGLSPWVIGITVFAIGTSLPELVTSLTAVLKKVSSISIGNIVGSNIFNILFVLGIVALIRPIPLDPSLLTFEMPLLLLFTFVFFTSMRLGYRINRWEGVLLFLGYGCFLFFLLRRSL